MDFPYLSLIIFLPVLGAILIALLPRLTSINIKYISVAATLIPLVLSIIIFAAFDRSADMAGVIQFEQNLSWIPIINAHYHIGVDGLSMPMVLLSALLGFLVILISWKINTRTKEYFAWILVLQASITGVFCSLDFLLFFIFWEIELIPMYFLISVWGSGRKTYSAMKYVIYTLLGGAFILAGILVLFFSTGSLNMVELAQTDLGALVKTAPLAMTFFFFLRLRHQAAGIPLPYLAARCPYGRPDGGQRDTGGHPA